MKKLAAPAIALALLLAACATVPTPPATAPGPDFLARNAAAKRVVTTPSGLQYFVVKSGLDTGETFDSSYAEGNPLTGEVGRFVPGFDEALKLMRPGDEWIVWIPPELGYGARSVGTIPPNSVLRFKLALHNVTPAAVPAP